MRHLQQVVIAAFTVAAGIPAVAAPHPAVTTIGPAPAAVAAANWRLVRAESFSTTLAVNSAAWVRDPLTASSRWSVDQLDDNGAVWHAISDPAISDQAEGRRLSAARTGSRLLSRPFSLTR